MRSERALRAGLAARTSAVVLVALTLGLSACGSDEGADAPTPEITPNPSPLLRIALREPIHTVDPLYARTRGERLLSRQIYEPLVSRQRGPFGSLRERHGPGGRLRPNGDRTIWRLTLKPGVSFQDGTPLDADAVRANVFQRWIASGVAGELLPALTAASSPRPERVQFQFAEPVRDFPERLADLRLAMISPVAISRAGTAPLGPGPTGSGPFEFREHQPGRWLLAANAGWWGKSVDLGPGAERIEALTIPEERERVDALVAGSVAIADDLGPESVQDLRGRPLVTTLGKGDLTMGLERSVRGLDSVSVEQSLADVWLTGLR